jgi:metallo-beta-lactamase family protein
LKLHFLGANRQVTGSRYCLEVDGRKIMIDCGMFQERAYLERNWEPSPIPPREIDALLLTHVHIDHSGLIPRLVHQGFAGPIYCTPASVPLADVLLRDAAEIQMEEAAYKQKRHAKEGRRSKYPYDPLFDTRDVERCLPLFRGVEYGQELRLGSQLSVRFFDAGHILGSAMLEFTSQNHQQPLRIIFSGDIGQWNKPLLHDPTSFEEADYIVMESTYGDRLHNETADVESQLARVINATIHRGGNVVIPVFAVERAQELMYYLGRLVHAKEIPAVPIFLDSPMAIDVTETFRRFQDSLDAETLEMIVSKRFPFSFPGLQMVRTADQSKAINNVREPCVIMASSGMCTAGRIKFHLRMNIERPEATILFVGYQGQGTLGRQIIERADRVRIHGRLHRVRAHVEQIHGLSGHADRAGLLRWLSSLRRAPRQIFLTHGDDSVAENFAAAIHAQLGFHVTIPAYQQTVELPVSAT